jgi:hypothetical protein
MAAAVFLPFPILRKIAGTNANKRERPVQLSYKQGNGLLAVTFTSRAPVFFPSA